MKTIVLSQRKTVFVDDADYDWLNQWKWCAALARYTFYAIRKIRMTTNRHTSEQMHRLILGLQPGDGQQCDHIDGNGLNNQRANLRVCTRTENNRSSRKRKVGSSIYKGVSWHCYDSRWQSVIRVNNKLIHLGRFNSQTDAARAYDVAALNYHGEFALTNNMLGLL